MKKALLLVVCMALVAAFAVSMTVAYFTDREEVVNVMTAGNVQIQLNEQQRDGNGDLEAFEQNKVLMPIVGSAQGAKDGYGMPTAKNFVDKIVSVTNTGKSDAFVRVLVAVPAALEGATANDNALHWNLGNKYAPNGDGIVPEAQYNWEAAGATIIDGIEYNVYAFYYDSVLDPGKTTTAAFIGFYLDSKVDFDGENYTINDNVINYNLGEGVVIPVMAQAVQVAGFEGDIKGAFDASGLPVVPWGANSFALVSSQAELDDAIAAGKKIILSSGEYKVSGTNDVVINGTGADTKIEIVGNIQNVNISNATVIGNNSFNIQADNTAVFKNVVFEGNVGMTAQGIVNADTTFEDCTFKAGFHIDSSLADKNIVFDGCTFEKNGYIKLGGHANYSMIDCTIETLAPDATGPWGKQWLIAYNDITFTDCTVGRVVRAGAAITITFDGCVDMDGNAVTEAIVHTYNTPNVVIK